MDRNGFFFDIGQIDDIKHMLQKRELEKELMSLCLGEFTKVLSIWFCFFPLKIVAGDWNGLTSILHCWTFILLQGSTP